MTKPTKPSRGRGPRAIAIIALIFAPLALSLSFSLYLRDTPIDRSPLLIGALAVFVLEIAAAMTTLLKKPIGARLFLIYGVAALLFVIVDGAMLWQLATYPEPEVHRGMASDLTHSVGTLLGLLFHSVWLVCSLAWPIAAMTIAGRWRVRADHFGAPAPAPFVPTPLPAPSFTPAAFSVERTPATRPSSQHVN
jgi:hypothetical protein